MEGAVAAVRSRGDTATADLWQEALDNLTMATPGDNYFRPCSCTTVS